MFERVSALGDASDVVVDLCVDRVDYIAAVPFLSRETEKKVANRLIVRLVGLPHAPQSFSMK